MNVLLDTNILGRMAEPGHPQHQPALDATAALRMQGDTPCLVPQVLYEFWVTATRPTAANRLGLSAMQAAAELAKLKGLFTLLPDTAAVYPEWERLVTLHQVRQERPRRPTGRRDGSARLDPRSHLQRGGFCTVSRHRGPEPGGRNNPTANDTVA